MTPYLVQLFGIGILWVSFHCVGMCGPIVAGLNASEVDGGSRRSRLRRGAANIFAYQGGRLVTYAIFGAAAGWVGGSVDKLIHGIGDVAALATGVVLIVVGASRLANFQPLEKSEGASTGGRIGRAARRLARLGPAKGVGRLAIFGAVMGFLPCMLMFWVLGLAASTQSALYGAAVMVGLVVMTTPVLLVAGTSPLLARGKAAEYGDKIAAGALLFSGVWLGLIGAASNGWIGHLKFGFEIAGRSFKMMLW